MLVLVVGGCGVVVGGCAGEALGGGPVVLGCGAPWHRYGCKEGDRLGLFWCVETGRRLGWTLILTLVRGRGGWWRPWSLAWFWCL